MTELEANVCRVLDPTCPELLRAVDLYELQVSPFRGGSNIRKRVRRIAAIKMLEHAERTMSAEDVVQIESYGILHREVMSGGWTAVRRLPSDRSFEKKLRKRIEQAKFVSDVIDFLCRYTVSHQTRKPSLALAQYVVRKSLNGEAQLSKASAQSRWQVFGREPILVHLLFSFELMPPQISTRQFADNLMAQIRNLDSIRNLFAARNFIIATLAPLAINVGEPITACELPTFRLQYEPIEPPLQRIIEEYRLVID
jgi:hypothetical protein